MKRLLINKATWHLLLINLIKTKITSVLRINNFKNLEPFCQSVVGKAMQLNKNKKRIDIVINQNGVLRNRLKQLFKKLFIQSVKQQIKIGTFLFEIPVNFLSFELLIQLFAWIIVDLLFQKKEKKFIEQYIKFYLQSQDNLRCCPQIQLIMGALNQTFIHLLTYQYKINKNSLFLQQDSLFDDNQDYEDYENQDQSENDLYVRKLESSQYKYSNQLRFYFQVEVREQQDEQIHKVFSCKEKTQSPFA